MVESSISTVEAGRRRGASWALLTAVALLGSVLAVATPSSAAPVQPVGAYTNDDWFVGSLGFVSKTYYFNGFPYQESFMVNQVSYQGTPTAPRRTPAVGQVFYMRLETAMVSDRFANWMRYRMELLLPAGVRPAVSAQYPLYCTIAVDLAPTREWSDCGGSLDGVTWVFSSVEIDTDESAIMWIPMVSTKALDAATVQMTAYREAGETTVDVNPILSTLNLTVRPTAPSAPRSVDADRGVKSAGVSWAAPSFNGGRVISGYTARAWSKRTGGKVVAKCVTSGKRVCTIKGLRSGTKVFVDVVAKNAIGTGPASTPRVAVTPK